MTTVQNPLEYFLCDHDKQIMYIVVQLHCTSYIPVLLLEYSHEKKLYNHDANSWYSPL